MSTINWNATIPFPTDTCFVARITKATFGPSKSSGNPMITVESEVVSPETYTIGDQEVNIAGVKVRPQYFTTKAVGDDGKTENARKRVFVSTDPSAPSLWEKLELDGSKEDPENPNVKQLEGLYIMVQMSSDEQVQRKTPTADQIAKAKKSGTRPEGDVMKNPKTGAKLVKYWPQVDEIFGVTTAPGKSGGPGY